MGLEPTEENRYFRLSSGRIIAFLSRWWRMASSCVSCPHFASTQLMVYGYSALLPAFRHDCCSYIVHRLRSYGTLLDNVLGVASGLRVVVAFLCLWKGRESNPRSGQNLRCTLLHLRVFPFRVLAGLSLPTIKMANRHHLHRLLRCRGCLIFSLLCAC